MDLITHWPSDWAPGWVETLTAVARDEAAHLAQVARLLTRRGGKLSRVHKNPYANALRQLVRKGEIQETLDRLLVSALIEARSCERFALLAAEAQATDGELARFYENLHRSELGHYQVFLKLARRVARTQEVEARWNHMLEKEAQILAQQPPGPRIHSGYVAGG